jgi:cystathionine beta-lyase/cystathionine gamma-synthase
MSQDYHADTLAVRAGIERSQFNEHSEALYLTSSFIFDNAAQAAARFSNAEPGNAYARYQSHGHCLSKSPCRVGRRRGLFSNSIRHGGDSFVRDGNT